MASARATGHNAGMSTPSTDPCPCGLPAAYAACCGVYHAGTPAPDAERLMRSRYSAYVQRRADYLLASWHPDTRPAELSLDDAPGQRTHWLGLTVHAHRSTGTDSAEVRFTARYRIGGGSAVHMAEHSRFLRHDGRWYYLDAV
ncbi:MAG: hypothetical protein GAK31_03324 [Stenotrophomonas maltophilia]|uniref:UPF0225 protein GAK31_03324 n=1 Tax=Stenotrophomonas maltophilia TaxID=40324 RepID=A0A7V8JK03_STEMA|nr:MAG: hypothetical protein GAK31_03324 [Stenotrophomonas maltophilia]